MAQPFDAVGGHTAQLFYGGRTDDDRTTLQKATTAWEVIYYIAMTCGQEIDAYVGTFAALPDSSGEQLRAFVQAVQGLRRFVPLLFSLRLPAAPWQPSSDGVRTAFSPLGGADRLRGTWLEIRNTELAALWAPLFVELFVGTIPVNGFSDAFDEPVWGIGLVDETSGMEEPAVMDIKLGFCRHSPFTRPEKLERIHGKEANSLVRKTALRICGMRRYRHDVVPHAREVHGKRTGYALRSAEELAAAVRAFFSTTGRLLQPAGEETDAPLVVVDRSGIEDAVGVQRQRSALKLVGEILGFFEDTAEGKYLIEHFAFVSTSLLFVYNAEDPEGRVVLRLIDLARSSHRRLNFDEGTVGFVRALQNAKAYL